MDLRFTRGGQRGWMFVFRIPLVQEHGFGDLVVSTSKMVTFCRAAEQQRDENWEDLED